MHHAGGGLRADVGEHRDDTLAAHGQQRDDLIVVAGVQIQLVADQRHGLHDLADVAVGLLDAADHRMIGQRRIGSRLDVDAGAGRHIVEDDRHRGGIRDGLVHLDEALLGGLVVVRRDHQAPVRADLAAVPGQLHGVVGLVRTGARDDRHPAGHMVHRELQHGPVLRIGQRGALTAGARNDQGVDALFDLPVDEPSERLVVDGQGVRIHGGDNGGGSAGKQCLFHLFILSVKKTGRCAKHRPESSCPKRGRPLSCSPSIHSSPPARQSGGCSPSAQEGVSASPSAAAPFP